MANHPPTVSGHSQTIFARSMTPLAGMFSFGDPDGDNILSFTVSDGSLGGGYFLHNGVRQPENISLGPFPLGQLSEWWFVAGSPGYSDTIQFRVTDSHGAISAPAFATIAALGAPLPTLLDLATLDFEVEQATPSSTVMVDQRWHLFDHRYSDFPDFAAFIYTNDDNSQVVLALRGMNPANRDSLFGTLGSFVKGAPVGNFPNWLMRAEDLLTEAHNVFPNATITITGHSLGGGISQILGKASGFRTVTFNPPGASELYPNVAGLLDEASKLSTFNQNPGVIENYRTVGDFVSSGGRHIGSINTIVGSPNESQFPDDLFHFVSNHQLNTALIPELRNPGTVFVPGIYEPRLDLKDILPSVHVPSINDGLISKYQFAAIPGDNLIDPSGGQQFVFSDSDVSPLITSITFDSHPGIASYKVWSASGTGWSTPQTVVSGVAVSFGAGTHQFKFEGLSASGQVVTLTDPHLLDITFKSTGQVNAELVTIPRPPANDFNADFSSDILWQKADGTPAVTLMNGLSPVSGAFLTNSGAAWHVKDGADFNGDGKADILWQNDNGTPAITLMNGLSPVSGAFLPNSGAAWHVKAGADFNGDGKADILWQNNDGTPAVTLMDGVNPVSGAFLSNSGPAWHVVDGADFNGDGKADILWQKDDGTPAVTLMDGLTPLSGAFLANAGSAWHVKAGADFNGDGKADILWQKNDGTPAITLMDGLTPLSGAYLPNAGSAWHVVGGRDFNGDGKADILWQHDNGTPAVTLMDGLTPISGAFLSNPGSDWHLI